MTDAPEVLPLAVDKQIDQVCDRFEQAWQSGQRPQIEEVLGAEQEPQRSALLRELLRVELELIKRAGGTWLSSTYHKRFPDHGRVVDEILAETARRAVSASKDPTISFRQSADDTASQASAPTQPNGPAIPEKFGRFEILKMLGQGAMGTVYHARDPKLEREVAIKVPRLEILGGEEQVMRFRREAQAAATLRHPNICPVYEIIDEDCRYAIVMAFIVGKPLSAYIKGQQDKPIAERQAANLVRKLAIALQVAHQKGIVHRDLKPDNIMIDQEQGEPVITDFGLARMTSADDLHLTVNGQIMGTPAYMPPEQARGDLQQIGPASDIYSLGVIFYELLCGKRPFKSPSVAEVLSDILVKQPQSPSVHRPSIDRQLEAICVKAMAKKIEDRYKSMAELAAALSKYMRATGEQTKVAVSGQSAAPVAPVGWVATQPTNDLVAPPESSILVQRTLRSHGKRSSWFDGIPRSRIGLVALSGAMLLLLAGVVFFVQTKDGAIRVEINDPEIEVAIKGTDIVLKQADNGQDVKLSPGDKTLVVEWGELKFETDKLILKKGETVTVDVRLLAGKVQVHQGDQLIGEGQSPSVSLGAAPAPAIAPFNAAQAKRHQQAWADYLKLPVEYTNSVGMKFVLIPPGEFTMGSTPEEIKEALLIANANKDWEDRARSEGPQRHVILTSPMYLSIYEVTQNDYEAVMRRNPSYFSATGPGKDIVANVDTRNYPVERVSWTDAAEFCAKLSSKENLKPFYFRAGQEITPLEGTGYRLPTEGEWEFACRAGTTTKYWIGDKDEDLKWVGSYESNSGDRTRAVGQLQANPFGLLDMYGNVFEWVADWWEPTSYSESMGVPVINPVGPPSTSFQRVLRGGSHHYSASFCRSSCRRARAPAYNSPDLGFRVSLVVEAVKAIRSDRRIETTDAQPSPTASGSITVQPPAKAPDSGKSSVPPQTTNEPDSKAIIHRLVGHTNHVHWVNFSHDGHQILTGAADGQLWLWDVESGKKLREYEGHTGIVHSANFTPDGQRILTVCGDGLVRLLDASSGEVTRSFKGHTEAAFSAVLSRDEQQIFRWAMIARFAFGTWSRAGNSANSIYTRGSSETSLCHRTNGTQ